MATQTFLPPTIPYGTVDPTHLFVPSCIPPVKWYSYDGVDCGDVNTYASHYGKTLGSITRLSDGQLLAEPDVSQGVSRIFTYLKHAQEYIIAARTRKWTIVNDGGARSAYVVLNPGGYAGFEVDSKRAVSQRWVSYKRPIPTVWQVEFWDNPYLETGQPNVQFHNMYGFNRIREGVNMNVEILSVKGNDVVFRNSDN